jgi:DNA-binding PadR family transcriptional regulator
MAKNVSDKDYKGPMGKMRSITLELKVLKCIEEKETYPYSLFKRLGASKHGHFFNVDKSELYNTIASLEKKDYIKVSRHSAEKKYYTITPHGRHVLRTLKKIYLKAFREILQLLSG